MITGIVVGILSLCGVVGGVIAKRAKTKRAQRAGQALQGISEIGNAAAPIVEDLTDKSKR